MFQLHCLTKALKPQMYDPRTNYVSIILNDVKDNLDLILKYPRKQNWGKWDEKGKKERFPKRCRHFPPTLHFWTTLSTEKHLTPPVFKVGCAELTKA